MVFSYFKRFEYADLIYVSNALVFLWAFISLLFGLTFLNVSLLISAILSSLGRYKKWWGMAFLPYILTLGVWIRIQNLPLLQGKFPLALDPYYFLRLARTYLAQGGFPSVDWMRLAPLGAKLQPSFFAYSLLITYKFLLLFFPNITLEFADILHPVIYFALGIVFFYLLTKKVFNSLTALIASAILTVVPAYLYRTTAGFSDHESIAMMFMFIAVWAFLNVDGKFGKKSKLDKAGKSGQTVQTVKLDRARGFSWALLSGLAIGFFRLSWGGGVRLFFVTLILYYIFRIMVGKYNLNQTYNLALIILGITLSHLIFYRSFALVLLMFKEIYFIPFFGLILFGIIFHFARRKTKTSNPYLVAGSLALAGFVGGLIIIGWKKLFSLVGKLIYSIFVPLGTGRLTLTVAENKVPYLNDWIGQFGIFFWLFIAGGLYLAYALGQKKYNWQIVAIVSVVLISLLFSNRSPYSALNGTSTASLVFFLSGILIAAIAVAFSYFLGKKNKKLSNYFKNLDMSKVFILFWWLSLVLASRGGIRIFIVLVPPAAVVASFLISDMTEKAVKSKDWPSKVGFFLIAVFLFIPLFASGLTSSIVQAENTGPGFNRQWQSAMSWVNSSTSKDSVFAHWWDYGYWVQAEGNRATVLDGGNTYVYWNHLLARHVLAGKTEKEALEFLFVHNVTHLLIISDEIGKYSAYSSIGSDEEFDIFSWIGTFVMNPYSTVTSDKTGITSYHFVGGSNLDEDLDFDGTLYTKKDSVISGFRIPVKNDDDPRNLEILQPFAIISKGGVSKEIPVQCIYDDGMKEFDSYGIGGCIRIFPRILNGGYQQENGALLWVSRRGFSALWTHLFLFEEESENFKLVYDDSDRYRLALYGSRTLGPLKIWKVNYPENFTVNNTKRAEYLNTTTDYWEKLNEENRKDSPLR